MLDACSSKHDGRDDGPKDPVLMVFETPPTISEISGEFELLQGLEVTCCFLETLCIAGGGNDFAKIVTSITLVDSKRF